MSRLSATLLLLLAALALPSALAVETRLCAYWGPHYQEKVYPDKRMDELQAMVDRNWWLRTAKEGIAGLGAIHPYAALPAKLISFAIQVPNEALKVYELATSYVREYVDSAMTQYNQELMETLVLDEFNSYSDDIERFGAAQKATVQIDMLGRAVGHCRKALTLLSNWRQGRLPEKFQRVKPLEPHQALHLIAPIGSACLFTEAILLRSKFNTTVTDEGTYARDLKQWQSLTDTAIGDLYETNPALANNRSIRWHRRSQWRLDTATSDEKFCLVRSPTPYPHGSLKPQKFDSTIHTVVDEQTGLRFRTAGRTNNGACPDCDGVSYPTGKQYTDLEGAKLQAQRVFEAYRERALNELPARLENFAAQAWLWQSFMDSSVRPSGRRFSQVALMGPFGQSWGHDQPPPRFRATMPKLPSTMIYRTLVVLCGTEQHGSWTLAGLETVVYGQNIHSKKHNKQYGELKVCRPGRDGYQEVKRLIPFASAPPVAAVEVDYNDVPRFMRLTMSDGHILELGHKDRRCGRVNGRQDCQTFDSGKLLPDAAYHTDSRTGKKLINWEGLDVSGKFDSTQAHIHKLYIKYRLERSVA